MVRALSKRFDAGGVAALADISFSVACGEFVALVGASGCGKSTLLRMIAGLEPVSSGEIRVDQRPILGPDRNRAMVFQDYSLYPWLTVLENVRFSLSLKANKGELAQRGAERAQLLLELMGLERVRDLRPHALSGGMRQRVAIARALLGRPELLLMDEPFGALDAQTRAVMHDLILHVLAMEQRTILFVTHDVEEAVYLADRVIVMAPAPGRIDSVWCPKLPPPLQRTQQLKRSPEFLVMQERILERIRATSALQSDFDALHRFTGHAGAGA
jgi:NitT/TauT family transport system ATP-binding protein